MKLDIQLLENSFEKVKPYSTEFSRSFYEKLFELYPELKVLFKDTNINDQEKKLFISLAIIVENLRSPDLLTLALKSLGAYHHEVGTIDEHYPFVRKALLETFAEYLGSDWNQMTEKAWLNAYDVIAEMMLEGAKNPENYLEGELNFYDWLELYGESSPGIKEIIGKDAYSRYRNKKASRES